MKSNLMSAISGIEESRPVGAWRRVCRIPRAPLRCALGYRISPTSGLTCSNAEQKPDTKSRALPPAVEQPRPRLPGDGNENVWTFDLRRVTLHALLVLSATCNSITNVAVAADDEDDDSHPGLVAQYTAAGKTIQRSDRDVQFVWTADSPDARLP